MLDKMRHGGGNSPRRSSGQLITALSFVFAILAPAAIGAASAEVAVTSTPIRDFLVGSSEKHFGKLQFIGGLSMRSSDPAFGAISSIRFRPDGRNFVAVLDTGHWMTGKIERDAVQKKGTKSGVQAQYMEVEQQKVGVTDGAEVGLEDVGGLFGEA